MKKWGIGNCNTGEVFHVYESVEKKDSTKYWNYKWVSSSGLCHHLELDPALEETPLEELSPMNLEIKDLQIQTGTQRIPDGALKIARDDEGEPLEDQDGNPVMVQDYKLVPVMETQKRVTLKSE